MCVHTADLQKGKGSLPALCAGSALQRAVPLSLCSLLSGSLHIPRHPSDIYNPIKVTLSQVPRHLKSFDALLLNIFYRINKISDFSNLNKLLNQLSAQIVRKL